jgi:hypothetical protein
MITRDLFEAAEDSDHNEPSAQGLSGTVRKMITHWHAGAPVWYQLPLGDNLVDMNPYIGQHLKLTFEGEINCLYCGELTNKSFGQGYCYKHFMSLAQNDSCIMSPEQCHYYEGTCREPEWGERNCMQSHYVYLSNSSAIKVGITRGGQIPTRWIDQGATQAITVARVTSRQLAGFLEVIFKKHVADKTNWRTMLKGTAPELDMAAERDKLFELAQPELEGLVAKHGLAAVQLLTHGDSFSFEFPVERYPEKVSSFNFDKSPVVEGVLQGIKGQYLIFDTGVINMRRFGGYRVSIG